MFTVGPRYCHSQAVSGTRNVLAEGRLVEHKCYVTRHHLQVLATHFQKQKLANNKLSTTIQPDDLIQAITSFVRDEALIFVNVWVLDDTHRNKPLLSNLDISVNVYATTFLAIRQTVKIIVKPITKSNLNQYIFERSSPAFCHEPRQSADLGLIVLYWREHPIANTHSHNLYVWLFVFLVLSRITISIFWLDTLGGNGCENSRERANTDAQSWGLTVDKRRTCTLFVYALCIHISECLVLSYVHVT